MKKYFDWICASIAIGFLVFLIVNILIHCFDVVIFFIIVGIICYGFWVAATAVYNYFENKKS